MGQFKKRIQQRYAEKQAEERWQKFEQIDLTKYKDVPSGCVACYRNNIASVQVYERTTAIGKVMLAGIRTHVESNSRLMTWRMKQRIKNEIFGAERSALEAYPPESELVDAADMFWLWVMPEGEKLPFSLNGAKRVKVEKKHQELNDPVAKALVEGTLKVHPRPAKPLQQPEGKIIAIVPEGMSVGEKIVDQAANGEVKTKRSRTKTTFEG